MMARVFSCVKQKQDKRVPSSKLVATSHSQLIFETFRYSLWLFILAVLFFPTPSHAREWYVSRQGSDNQAGTVSSPFLTIIKASQVAKSGDTIMLRGGTYLLNSSQRVDNGGSPGSPITVQSYPGEWAVLDGKNLTSGHDALIVGKQYVNLKNFEIANSPNHGISIWGGKNIVISGLTVRGSQRNGIYMGHSNPWTIDNVKVEKSKIFNNVLTNINRNLKWWPAALACNSCTNIVFENNTVYNNYGEGINFNQVKGGRVKGNKVFDNFSANVYLDQVSYVTISQNFLYTKEDTRFFRDAKSATQIKVANEGSNNYLTNLTITGNILIGGLAGFRYSSWGVGGGLRNTLFANNTIYAAYGSSEYLINIDQDLGHSGTRIANNIFQYSGGGWGLVRFFNHSGISWDHNSWYGGSAKNAASSTDIITNPMFANPGTHNADGYRLTESSPCRKVGSTIPAASIDFAGVARNTPYDLGAYAY